MCVCGGAHALRQTSAQEVGVPEALSPSGSPISSPCPIRAGAQSSSRDSCAGTPVNITLLIGIGGTGKGEAELKREGGAAAWAGPTGEAERVPEQRT